MARAMSDGDLSPDQDLIMDDEEMEQLPKKAAVLKSRGHSLSLISEAGVLTGWLQSKGVYHEGLYQILKGRDIINIYHLQLQPRSTFDTIIDEAKKKGFKKVERLTEIWRGDCTVEPTWEAPLEVIVPEVEEEKSVWGIVPTLPPDAIFWTKTACTNDPHPQKINLGIGAFRTDEGVPYILKVVEKVEQSMIKHRHDLHCRVHKEYLPIRGLEKFVAFAQMLLLGPESASIKEGTVAGVQSLSGTGALRIICEFVEVCFGKVFVFTSKPTWGNHHAIIRRAGLREGFYRYWNPKTLGLDLHGMFEDLKHAKPGSFVLLHACAHNPTGVDPTRQQWHQIADFLKEHKLIPFFDCAYQGFATGDLDADAFAIRLFEKKGMEFVVAQSFAKNLGLYGERTGTVTVVCQSAAQRHSVQTQLNAVVRAMYSNSPRHGATIAYKVMESEEYMKLWQEDMTYMSGRIKKMRSLLKEQLIKLETPGNWDHITNQVGMFSFTGLTRGQCEELINKHHIYLLKNGRISISGITPTNVEYLAKAIDTVVRNIE